MIKRKLFILTFFLLIFSSIDAQVKDYELGSSNLFNRYNQASGYFDFSDPEAVNIKVSIWGFVRYPGKYVVPIYTTVIDLLSYAGGPTDAAHLDDLRIYRVNEDSTQVLIKIDYNDIMYESKLTKAYKKPPNLEAGDILVVPGAPRLYTRDKVSIWVSVLSALISLSILILNITRN
ncbi:MAG: SLBB domain-containing protein [Melioribacter sp.]|uniref:SLBB domain-containing protein n=1 Tax=Rosettibacter primus TaxID=3111523 RepID=UPI00247D18B0|nr:SLBB domain-containing protein [Melioribacter sp.]